MTDIPQKQIIALQADVAKLQKVVSNLVNNAQLTSRAIRTLKAKNESLNSEIIRLNHKIKNTG